MAPVSTSDAPDQVATQDSAPAGDTRRNARIEAYAKHFSLLQTNPAMVRDTEIVEMLLTLVETSAGPQRVAAALFRKIGSLTKIVQARLEELNRIDDICDAQVVDVLTLVRVIVERAGKASINKATLASSDAIKEYLLSSPMHDDTESKIRVLYLDSRNELLADVVHNRDFDDRIQDDVRYIAMAALKVFALSVVVIQNVKDSGRGPTRDDVTFAHDIRTALNALEIRVYDHIMIGNGVWFSLGQSGYFGWPPKY